MNTKTKTLTVAAKAESWATTEQVAEHISKPVSWVHNNAGVLGIPRVRIGNHYRYKISQVDHWLGEAAA